MGRSAARRANSSSGCVFWGEKEFSSPLFPRCGTGRRLFKTTGRSQAANPSTVSPAVGTGDGLAGGEGSEPWLSVYLHAGIASSAALCPPARVGSSARGSLPAAQPPFMQLKGFASERLNYLWISRAVPTRVCSAARPFCWMSWSFPLAARNFSWDLFGSGHPEEVLGWLGRHKPCE